jgi:hypothetical protein
MARLSNSNITLAFFLLLNVIYSKKSYINHEFMYMDQNSSQKNNCVNVRLLIYIILQFTHLLPENGFVMIITKICLKSGMLSGHSLTID